MEELVFFWLSSEKEGEFGLRENDIRCGFQYGCPYPGIQ